MAGIENATNVVLSVTSGGSLQEIAHCTSASLSVSLDLRDSTTKSSGGFQANLAGLKSWELSGEGFVEIAGVAGKADSEELFTTMLAGTAVQCTFGLTGMLYTGDAIITSFSLDAGVEENATYSITLTGTGTLTQS
jgi:predicted secreted protein|tara:strand:- start:592 stop:999 length:408 start_codon:yes stop_codon:yes gene_type:complete